MKDWMREHKFYLVAAVLLAAGVIYYFNFWESPQTAVTTLEQETGEQTLAPQKEETEVKQLPEKIIVDVKGQIRSPGVYQASTDERVMDVITRAGGLTEKADQNQVNFAEHVHDEMVIYIPAKGEEGDVKTTMAGNGAQAAPGTGNSQAKIDLNKADVNELQNLPGIGPAKAAAIVEYREKNGKFAKTEDLKNISGIGDKTFDKLKDLIVVH